MDPVKKTIRNFKDCKKKLGDFYDFEFAGDGENPMEWAVVLNMGEEGTPFDNGKFSITVSFPDNYPFVAPDFSLNPKQCYHPNVGMDGRICLAMLKDQWDPACKMVTVFEAIRGLFIAPDGAHGEFRPEVAEQFTNDYDSWAVQKAVGRAIRRLVQAMT